MEVSHLSKFAPTSTQVAIKCLKFLFLFTSKNDNILGMMKQRLFTIYSEKSRLINSYIINGTRQNPNGNFHGDALVSFPRPLNSLAQPKRPGTSKNFQMVSTFSVRKFSVHFQEITFSRENFRSWRQNQSFHLHSIRNFQIICNG